ncbi:hypothetical protein PGQ11_002915 [Apiospora arundinis]|uniref:Uncharacterized protein n=1 Tax=Apiospora arundinis TaxID=335852 RepID=A0ABR2J3L3_9PEZI
MDLSTAQVEQSTSCSNEFNLYLRALFKTLELHVVAEIVQNSTQFSPALSSFPIQSSILAYDPEDEDTNDELTTALTEYMVDINFAAFSFFWFTAALCVLVDTYIFLNSTSIIDIDHDDVENKRTFIAGIILTGVFDLLVVLDMTISLVYTLAGVHKLALFATSAI